MGAKLILGDGTEIEISSETETELRKAFSKSSVPEDYINANIQVHIDVDSSEFPIEITTTGSMNNGLVSRSVEDIKNLITALQEAVEYCEQNDLTD